PCSARPCAAFRPCTPAPPLGSSLHPCIRNRTHRAWPAIGEAALTAPGGAGGRPALHPGWELLRWSCLSRRRDLHRLGLLERRRDVAESGPGERARPVVDVAL